MAPSNPHDVIKVASPQIDQDDVDAVVEALWSGRLTTGPKVEAFEQAFAAHTGCAHAVAVNSGTAALHASLAALGVGPGDEVIVPALTFFSTVTAVIHQGGVPVFCDIDADDFCLSPASLEAAVTERTKGVIPVHYFGNVAKMERINAIAEARSLFVVEDCAQAHGSAVDGRRVGSLGTCGAFSFFATKHMTTCEGGIVTTDDERIDAYIRSFRSHGMEGRNDHVILGYNYRMPEPLGALGLSQLRRLDALNEARITVSERIIDRLRHIPWMTLPEPPSSIRHTYFWLHALIDEERLGMNTQELIERLGEQGVEVRHRYVEPLYRQPLLTKNIPPLLRLSAGDHLPDYGSMHLPTVESLAGRVIGLPNRPDMGDDEIERLVAIITSLGDG